MSKKKIIVVGSSTSLFAIQGGSFVDSCDFVVRTNHGVRMDSRVEYFGSKFDAWANALNKNLHTEINELVRNTDYSNTEFWWGTSTDSLLKKTKNATHLIKKNEIYEEYKNSFFSKGKVKEINQKIKFEPIQTLSISSSYNEFFNYSKCFKNVKSMNESVMNIRNKFKILRPTLGFITLNYVIDNFKDYDVYILGYGIYGKRLCGIYHKMADPFLKHKISEEDEIIKKFEDDKVIYRLENIL